MSHIQWSLVEGAVVHLPVVHHLRQSDETAWTCWCGLEYAWAVVADPRVSRRVRLTVDGGDWKMTTVPEVFLDWRNAGQSRITSEIHYNHDQRSRRLPPSLPVILLSLTMLTLGGRPQKLVCLSIREKTAIFFIFKSRAEIWILQITLLSTDLLTVTVACVSTCPLCVTSVLMMCDGMLYVSVGHVWKNLFPMEKHRHWVKMYRWCHLV